MKRIFLKDINLIIDCFNNLPSRVNDFLAFISFYSFYYQFEKTLNPLILIPTNKSTNINYWASSFKIPLLRNNFNFNEVIQKPAFRIKAGIIALDQNFCYSNSFDLFESHGIQLISEKENNFSNTRILGNLNDDYPSSFIDLSQYFCFNEKNMDVLGNLLKFFSNKKDKINEVLLTKMLDKVSKLYVNFSEIR